MRKGNPQRHDRTYPKRAKNNTLTTKTKNRYGRAKRSNVGVSQGSAISAILFIIYKDDRAEDYESLNRATYIPLKHTPERTEKEAGEYGGNELRKELDHLSDDAAWEFIRKINRGRHLFTRNSKNRQQTQTEIQNTCAETERANKTTNN